MASDKLREIVKALNTIWADQEGKADEAERWLRERLPSGGTYLVAYADEQGCISVRVNGEWIDVQPRSRAEGDE